MNFIHKIWTDERTAKLLRYGFFGVATTGVNFGVFILLRDIVRLELNVSNTIAVLLSILFAYFTNKRFVFQSKTGTVRETFLEMVSFFSARGITMLLDVGTIFVLHTLLKIDKAYSFYTKAAVNILVLVLNYVFSQQFIFKKRHAE